MLLLSGVILLNFSILFLANQPESKVCVHGYLFPLPVALGPVPHPIYDATAGTEPVSHRWQIGYVPQLKCRCRSFFLVFEHMDSVENSDP